MQDLLNLIRWMLVGLFRSKTSLEAEILALRRSAFGGDVDDRFGEGLRRLLGQIVPYAARDGSV